MPHPAATLAITLAALGNEEFAQLKLIPSLNFTATDKEIGTLCNPPVILFCFELSFAFYVV
jgi:hypothetical protein